MYFVIWGTCNLFCLEESPEHICMELDEITDHHVITETYAEANQIYIALADNPNVRDQHIARAVQTEHHLFWREEQERIAEMEKG